MEKTINLRVSLGYDCPSLYSEGTLALRELALSIGARVVSDVLATEHESEQCEERLVEMQNQLARSEASQRESREARDQLIQQIAALQDQHQVELFEKLHVERARIRQELSGDLLAQEKHAHREALLAERERHAAERESIVARLEERHATLTARSDSLVREQLADSKRALEQLRAEHEGLVVKLMTRLEPVGMGRGGTGATTSAAALGRTFEENVERHLRQAFGAREGFHLEDVHATGHCGDLLMVFDGLRILVELKSYDPKTRVPTKEVEKLARDLAEVQPPCNAAIMISACSDITGHYSCGPLEVSASVACVPVLFVNNFLSLGEPIVTLHMTRVFLSMIHMIAKRVASPEEDVLETDRMSRLQRSTSECARRCTGYLTELNRQSTELLRQVTTLKNGANRLRDTVIAMVESEVARFGGIIQLMTHVESPLLDIPVVTLDRSVFSDPSVMSEAAKTLAESIASAFVVGDLQQKYPTKDLLAFIQEHLKITSEKAARDALKSIFVDSVVKHGYVLGLVKKT